MELAKSVLFYMRGKNLHVRVKLGYRSFSKSIAKDVVFNKEAKRVEGSGYLVERQNEFIDRILWMKDRYDYRDLVAMIKGSYDPFFLDYMKRYHYMLSKGMCKGQLTIPSKSHLNTLNQLITAYKEYGSDFRIKEYAYHPFTGSEKAEYTRGLFFDFCSYLRNERKLAVSSQKTYLAVLRSVLDYMRDNDGITIIASLKTPKAIQKTVYTIPMDSISGWTNLVYEKGSLEWSVHLYSCIQIFSCLRIGDVLSICSTHLDMDSKSIFISNKKTGSWTLAALPKSIFDKIEFQLSTFGSMVHPDLVGFGQANQNKKINYTLKKIMKDVGALDATVDHRSQSPDGSITTEQVKLYSLLTTHSFRKTGATMYRSFGLSDQLIKTMTGHSKGSNLLDTTYTRIENPSSYIRASWETLGLQ